MVWTVWTVKCDSQIIIIITVAVIYIRVINTVVSGSGIYTMALKYILPDMVFSRFPPHSLKC